MAPPASSGLCSVGVYFRAFEAYWSVPGTAATAREGKWVKGPGDDFFAAVKNALGETPFIAEDLVSRGL